MDRARELGTRFRNNLGSKTPSRCKNVNLEITEHALLVEIRGCGRSGAKLGSVGAHASDNSAEDTLPEDVGSLDAILSV